MGWIKDFENWTKGGYTFGDLEKDIKGYKILKMPPKEAAVKAGEKTRSDVLYWGDVGGSAIKSLLGMGEPAKTTSNGAEPTATPEGRSFWAQKYEEYGIEAIDPRNLAPWLEDRYGEGLETAEDVGGGAVDTVVKTVEDTGAAVAQVFDMDKWMKLLMAARGEGALVKMPEINIPAIDLSPLAAGLAAMGAGIGEGLGIDTSLTDDEGDPNLVLIAALAAVGLGGVYLISKR